MWEITDPGEAARRDAALLQGPAQPPHFPGLAGGVLHRDGNGTLVPPAGELFVQGRVSYQGRSGRLDDLIGQGFQVMGWNVDPLSLMDDDQVSFLSEIGARAVPASATYKPGRDVVNDLRGVYARWFEQNKVQAVVVRPDYYVFGGVSDAAQLPQLIDDLRRQLGLTTPTRLRSDHAELRVSPAQLGETA